MARDIRYVSPTRVLRSTTFRLALIYLGLFSASALILLVFIDWSTAGFIRRQTDAVIEAEIRGLAEQFDQRGTIGLIEAINRRSAQARATRGLYLVTGPDLSRISGNLSRWPDAIPDADGWMTFPVEYGEDGEDLGRARIFQFGSGLRLLVGRDIRERREIAVLIRRTLGGGLAITLVLSIAGGLLLSRSVLGQIESVNETSRRIMSGDLERRVPTTGSGDEFDQLAHNLNAMLDRIEELIAGMKQVTDNIAHDLRSPLTRLRSRLEVTLMEAPNTESYREALQTTIAETDQLLRTFNALLRIGYAESGAPRAAFADLDLSALLDDVVEFYEPVLEENGLRLVSHTEGAMRIRGDRDLLFQCIGNLLDNAIKYAADGEEVTLTLARLQSGPVIRAADRGSGIPEERRQEVLERFRRLDASRGSAGSGLGLSLVAAVAKLHEAELSLGSNEPGLAVELRFGAQASG